MLLNLPVEVLDLVIGYLSIEALANFRQTNKLLHHHLTPILWRHLKIDTSGDFCGAGGLSDDCKNAHIWIQPNNLDKFTMELFKHNYNFSQKNTNEIFSLALQSIHKITFRLKYIPSIYSSICASCALKDMIGPFSKFCTNLTTIELIAEYNDNEKACRWLDLLYIAFPKVEKIIDLSACGWLSPIPMTRIAQGDPTNVTQLAMNSYGSNLLELLENYKLPRTVQSFKIGSCMTRVDPKTLQSFFSDVENLEELHIDRLDIFPYMLSWMPQTVKFLALICPSEIQLPFDDDDSSYQYPTRLSSIRALFVDTRSARLFKHVQLPHLESLELYSGFKPEENFSKDLNDYLIEQCPQLIHLNCSIRCALDIFSIIAMKLKTLTIHSSHCSCDNTDQNKLLELLNNHNCESTPSSFNLVYL